jgi:hypothetical protein
VPFGAQSACPAIMVSMKRSSRVRKISALATARFFLERKARADFKAFDRIMKRRGGKPPRAGDEMPQR